MTNDPSSTEKIFYPQVHSAGFFWGQLDQDAKERVLEECSKEASARFKAKVAAYIDATGLRKPPAAQRLQDYRTRPGQTWAELQAGFPHVYKEQMDDWRTLEHGDMAREKPASPPGFGAPSASPAAPPGPPPPSLAPGPTM